MASDEPEGAIESADAAEAESEFVSFELLAPPGWKKKFTPKMGGTPRRTEIVFISPTDEEIKNKKQLDQYLKSHPGGPSSSEFEWGTGDTPRRSARISEKAKATESPEGEKPKKRERKSSSKKGSKEKKEDAAEEAEEAAADVEMKETAGAEMKEAETSKEGLTETAVNETAVEQDSADNDEKKTEETAKKVENSKEPSKDGPLVEEKKVEEEPADPLVEEKKVEEEPADSEALPLQPESKGDAWAKEGIGGGEVSTENGSQKDDKQHDADHKEALAANSDDGQHPPDS